MLHHYLPEGLATPYLISEWVIRIGMLFFVPTRRTPQAAQAWLLLIFFLPLPGLILYAAIGRPRFPDWRTERFHRLASFFRGVSEALAQAGSVPDENEVAALAAHLGTLPATQGNRIEFLGDYDRSIDRLIADLEAARQSVRIVTYIFADDEVGTRMISA